ncbi:WGR domain-containing protein [Roseovarius aestuarii]|nr:WGR domain-containing protein [Roseovarius aestuarii]
MMPSHGGKDGPAPVTLDSVSADTDRRPDVRPSQLDLFPDRAYLRCVDPAANKARFYVLAVQPTLFGGVDLVCEWGRIGSPGTVRFIPHRDTGQALDTIRTIAAKRKARGYIE